MREPNLWARRWDVIVVVMVLLLLPGRLGWSQSSLERLEFSFANPGARSMGFGGAFVALADDPTGAFANPGGLVQLLRPEAFIDVRLGFESHDDSTEPLFGDDSTEVTNLTFASFVLPVRRCSLAAYGHQIVKTDLESFNQTTEDETLRDLDITRYAVAGACQLLEQLSFGIGVSYFDAGYRVMDRAEASGDWGLNGGLLWKPVDRLSLGAFYRQGPELDLQNSSRDRLALPDAYGLGVAVRSSNGRFTLSAEWDRVVWSQMFEGLSSTMADEAPMLRDVDELHLGVEYAWNTTSKVLALRFGAWRDPDKVADRADGDDDRTRIHGAAGFGIAWQRFQLDVATDFARDVVTLGVSGMFIF